MYKCEHFIIQELVDKYTYEKFGDLAWQFFDEKALMMFDGIREYFNKATYINDWDTNGVNQFRGLRPSYVNIGAMHSLHKFGKAGDMTISGVSAEEARIEIKANKDHELLKYINCIEADVLWLHSDVRNIDNRILLV